MEAYEGTIGLSAGVIPPPHLVVEDVRFLGGEFMILFICDTYATEALSVLVIEMFTQPCFDLFAPPNQIPSSGSTKTLCSSPGAKTWRISVSNVACRAITSS